MYGAIHIGPVLSLIVELVSAHGWLKHHLMWFRAMIAFLCVFLVSLCLICQEIRGDANGINQFNYVYANMRNIELNLQHICRELQHEMPIFQKPWAPHQPRRVLQMSCTNTPIVLPTHGRSVNVLDKWSSWLAHARREKSGIWNHGWKLNISGGQLSCCYVCMINSSAKRSAAYYISKSKLGWEMTAEVKFVSLFKITKRLSIPLRRHLSIIYFVCTVRNSRLQLLIILAWYWYDWMISGNSEKDRYVVIFGCWRAFSKSYFNLYFGSCVYQFVMWIKNNENYW